jgi:hypothetical protein
MTDHPITPPPELIRQWNEEAATAPMADQRYIAIQAARWGADQELEACLQSLDINGCPSEWIDMLRLARRPKPPSLAEQAQRILVENGTTLDGRIELDPDDIITIRAALERLQELENK